MILHFGSTWFEIAHNEYLEAILIIHITDSVKYAKIENRMLAQLNGAARKTGTTLENYTFLARFFSSSV